MNFNEIIPFSEYYSLSSSIEEEQSALSMLGASLDFANPPTGGFLLGDSQT